MDSNDISDEYRKAMVEGLEAISRIEHLPALSKTLIAVIQEIRLLDKQVTRLQQENQNLKEQITNHFLSEIIGKPSGR